MDLRGIDFKTTVKTLRIDIISRAIPIRRVMKGRVIWEKINIFSMFVIPRIYKFLLNIDRGKYAGLEASRAARIVLEILL